MAQVEEFQELVKKLTENAHGVAYFSEVKNFLSKNLKSTSKRLTFLDPFLSVSPISWEKVKDLVWTEQKDRDDNKFHFIQGDIIETTTVGGIGKVRSTNEHTLWLVLSPDCDCIRASYIRVAPVFSVNKGDSDNYGKFKEFMSAAARFNSPKYFPLGIDPFEDGSEGLFADLTEPYFIAKSDKEIVTIHYSMKVVGWHLLNAVIKESETRANIQEGEKIRSVVPAVSDEMKP